MKRPRYSPFIPPGTRHAVYSPLSTLHYPLSPLLCLLLLCGCGGDRPRLGAVRGTVTLDGKPLPDACVIFEPTTPGRASMGWTDAKGRYELTYIRDEKGARVGTHKVRISATKGEANSLEILSPRYNLQTTLEAEVKRGQNEIDFPLTSQ